MKLHVIDHSPHDWFLLRHGEDHYLDVNCGIGAVGFSILVRLSQAEREEYRALGRDFTAAFAARISDSPHLYRERDLSSSLGTEVSDAVERFRSR